MIGRSCASLSLLVLTGALAAACGRAPAAPTAAAASEASLDACVLFLRQDLDPDGSMELRKIRTAIDQTAGAYFAKCAWGVPRTDIFTSLEVRRMESAERALAAQRDGLPVLRRLADVELEPVEGIGDTATWAGGRLNQLHFVSGRFRLILTLEIGPVDERVALAKRIAALVLERVRILDVNPATAPAGNGA